MSPFLNLIVWSLNREKIKSPFEPAFWNNRLRNPTFRVRRGTETHLADFVTVDILVVIFINNLMK